MTKQKSTKRALLLSALSLLMCVSMLIGSTFAWFTDSVTSGSNIIKSGTLDIVMEYWDGSAWVDAEGKVIPFVAADGRTEILWEPGCTYEMAPFRIRNEGNLAAKILIMLSGVKGDEKLMEAVELKTRINNIPESALNGSAANVFGKFEDAEVGILYGMPEGNIVFDWSLAGKGNTTPGTGHTDTSPEFTIFGHMKEEAGNEYPGLSIEGISITAIATQQVYENDSFNNRYDVAATYPKVSQLVSVPENATEPIKLDTGDLDVELPADLLNDLPDEIKQLQLVHTEARADAGNSAVVFDSVEVFDQDGKKVDLEAMGNTTPIAVTLPASNSFAAGERVYIYHDGEHIATTNVNADGTISYKAVHFCEVSVSDTLTAKINSAEEFISVLNEIKTEAKKQIPGATGNKNYRENAVFILENDIVIDENTEFMYTDSNGAPLHFYGVKGVLDLNGHTITVTADAVMDGKAYANAALLVQYSNIDIIGEGSIITQNQSIPVYGWANGTVNIYGGTYITNASERTESAIYVNNPSMAINVYGGNFGESVYAFNAHDTSCGNNTVMVLHEGVSCPKFLKNGTTDVITSDINAGRLQLADGCTLEEVVINGETWYQVVAK